MKKVMKLVAILAVVGIMAASVALSASAASVHTDLKGIVFSVDANINAQGDITVNFLPDSNGIGATTPYASWGFADLKATTSGGLSNPRIRLNENNADHGIEGLGSGTIVAGWNGGAAFPNKMEAPYAAIFVLVEADPEAASGSITFTGEYTLIEMDETETTYPINFTLNYEAAGQETEAETEAGEPTEPGGGTQATTTAATTTAATTTGAASVATTGPATVTSAPKGGVALAIIPTIVAAGAAIVATKKRK